MKLKKILVNETMFGGGVCIVIGDEQEFYDFYNNKYSKIEEGFLEIDGKLGGFYRPEKANLIEDKSIKNYIYLKKFSWEKEDLNVLFHEIQHYVIHELNRREISLLYDGGTPEDEVFAYFSGEVSSKILLKLIKEYPKLN